MNTTDILKEYSTRLILSGLSAFLGFLFGSIYSEIYPTFLQKILEATPKTLLLKLLLVAIIGCVLLFVLSCYFYLHNRNKLIPKFCVLWDKNKEPYCPAHQIALSDYCEEETPPLYSFKCYKCTSRIYLLNYGKSISLLEAQKLLK
jgi:hypothetical protein